MRNEENELCVQVKYGIVSSSYASEWCVEEFAGSKNTPRFLQTD